MLLGLVSAVVLAHGSVLKAILMILLGILLGLVGTDVSTGDYRFTLGLDLLFDGIGFVPISMGLFGLAEIISNLEERRAGAPIAAAVNRLWPSWQDFRQSFGAMVRGTAVGTAFGILPGGGPTISAFTAYSWKRKSRARPSASATERSKALPRRKPPTTPPRRPASSRCSASASRRTR